MFLQVVKKMIIVLHGQLKAEKLNMIKIKKQLIYKNAILKIYDIPVFYFPKFFHPDPTVKRQSGFLKPKFNNSNVLGSSINISLFLCNFRK